MLWFKAWHIIAMVAWFAGLFYLPRLFVYHADCTDTLGIERFKIMERRLYYGIIWPAAIVASTLGICLVLYNPAYYLHASWFHAKCLCVALVWAYQLGCGHYRLAFSRHRNTKTSRFFRMYNELPTLLLIAIVLLVVLKPY